MLEIIDTGIDSAEKIMRFDGNLLENLDPNGKPILHFYRWAKPSATYGYFISPEKHLDLKKAEEKGLALARRPTGGGIVFHIWDLAFSFLMPSGHPAFSENTLENYRFVNEAVLAAMRKSFPFKSGRTDRGRGKIAGLGVPELLHGETDPIRCGFRGTESRRCGSTTAEARLFAPRVYLIGLS